MVNYNYLIIGFINFIIIFIFFLYKKNIINIPGFSKNTIDITVNSKNSKCDISITDSCKCKINYSDKSDITNNYSEDLNAYNLEKKYYKVKQDLVPYWKHTSWELKETLPLNNPPLNIIEEDRIYQLNKNFYFNENNETVTRDVYDKGKIPSYRVNACDLIPCKNLGYKNKNNPEWNKNNNPLLCELKNKAFNSRDIEFSNTKKKTSKWFAPKNLNIISNGNIGNNLSPSIQAKSLINKLSGLKFNNCTSGFNNNRCDKNKNVFNILSKNNNNVKTICSNQDNLINRYNDEAKFLNLNE